jgi:pSer/pThr/pTyr-binding forkhead associated (FHA) protein
MYVLSIVFASGLAQNFQLEKAYYTIGRGKNCDIHIANNRFISRVHSTLVIAEEEGRTCCLLIDGSLVSGDRSSNGTWVNGDRVNKVKLNHQDVITFGQGSILPSIVFYIEETDTGGDTIEHEKD